MRRELEDIIQIFLAKMEQKNWKVPELHKAMGEEVFRGMNLPSIRRHLTGHYKYPNAKLIGKIGRALGIEPETVNKAEQLAAEMSKGWHRQETIKKQKIDEISSLDARLRKARNYFQLGRKELNGIDEDIGKVIGHLVERMRSLSGLSESLKIFEKN